MTVIKYQVASGSIRVSEVDEHRLTTAAPCEVHNRHRPVSHVNEIHHVWPKGDGGPNIAANRLVVCATGHNNIHRLMQEMKLYNGNVPWVVLKGFGVEERDVAKLGYERIRKQAM